jgi:hypothetical protein
VDSLITAERFAASRGGFKDERLLRCGALMGRRGGAVPEVRMSTFGKGGNGREGDLVSLIDARLDRRRFQDQHWEGSFREYLELCEKNPGVVRNAYQRLYDAVLSHGFEKYKLFKKDCIRYHFFSDPFDSGADGIFGLDFA